MTSKSPMCWKCRSRSLCRCVPQTRLKTITFEKFQSGKTPSGFYIVTIPNPLNPLNPLDDVLYWCPAYILQYPCSFKEIVTLTKRLEVELLDLNENLDATCETFKQGTAVFHFFIFLFLCVCDNLN